MRKDNYYNNIEDYILGRMLPDEIRRFEEQIRKNPDLNEDVNLYRGIITATGNKRYWDFRNKLERINKHDQKKIKPFRFIFSRRFFIPLTFLVILAIALIPLFKPQPKPLKTEQNNSIPGEKQDPGTQPNIEKKIAAEQDPQKTKDEQKHNSDLPTPKVDKIIRPQRINYIALANSEYIDLGAQGINKSPQSQKSNLEKAWLAYARRRNINNILDTAKLYDVIALLEPPDSTNLFDCLKLRANAYFQVGHFKKAAQDFQNDIFTGTFYQYDAEWNLLLCQLALLPGSRVEFDRQMEKILNKPTHTFYQDAISLKEKLSRVERK
ncbi:MAG TPA: hypothetical protein PKE06_02905 [Flavilitoribacter sp.]|nr:hypothetical protein [Flavilitoribacter sp.]HMQ86864.1 hypothetical protein [Flavilitoribacter sp.]